MLRKWTSTKLFPICTLLLFCCAVVGTALAQVKSTTITGNVIDSSGGRVVGAVVTVTNTNTGVVTNTKSNNAGDYTVPYLQEGTYSVQVQAPGFKSFRADGLRAGTGTTLKVNAVLPVGAATQTVNVNASSAQLQTESASVQGSVSSNIIMNVPNITNNPIYYATLQAGAVPSPAMYDGEALGVGTQDRKDYSAIRINGSAVGTNDVQIDGLSVQGSGWHESAVIPNRDALQEVRVDSNNMSADLGGGQSVIALATKSGTNEFHGDLNYRIRNEAFNANGLAQNIQGIPRGQYRLNEGGGAIGGPVILPHLFNGKDKMFFFVSYSRLSHSEASQGFEQVPTALQRAGDFGSTLTPDQNGNPIPVQIYDPFSAVRINPTTVQRTEYPQGSCDGGFLAAYGRCGDRVANADSYGLKLLNAYPAPNHAPSDVFGHNNYYYSGIAPTVRNNLSARMDFHFWEKHAIYVSGGLENGSSGVVNVWGPGPWYDTNDVGAQTDSNPYAQVGDTITLNPTTLVDVRFGVTRVNTTNELPSATNFTSSTYASYGMFSSLQSLIGVQGTAPTIGTWTNTYTPNAALNFDAYIRKNQHETNPTFAGSVTKILGKWTLKNGAEYRDLLGNWADLEYGTPALNPFLGGDNSQEYANLDGSSSSLNTAPQQQGYGGAVFATGVMGWTIPQGSAYKPALSAKYVSFFSQNDWKATRKLTVNLGLRYEVQPGPTERHNRMFGVDLNAASPYARAGAGPNPLAAMGAIDFPATQGYSRNLWNTQWNNISPRLGAAYQLNERTVIRGGFGRFYTPSNTGFNANGTIYGSAAFADGANPIPYGLTHTGVPVGTFDQPQNTEILHAHGAVQAPQLYGQVNGGGGVDGFLRNGYKNGYLDQWNVTAERSLGGWITSMAYVGSRGADLGWRNFNINGQFNIPWPTLMDWQDQWISSNGNNNPGANQVSNPVPALIGGATGDSGNTTISYMESQEPYLGLLGTTVYASKGTSLYNSLQLNAQHPFANGLSVLMNYTWSKSQGISGGANGSTYAESQIGSNYQTSSQGVQGEGVDYRTFNNNNSLLTSDVPQRFVAAAVYELPFGRGKRFDPQNGIARSVIGGWTLSPVVTLQSGQPWGPYCSSENGRCIPTGQSLELPKSYQHWYDGKTSVTLPDGHVVTPPEYTYLKWNPDAFGSKIVNWADGTPHVAEYWLGTTPMVMGSLRTPAFQNINLDVSKQVQIAERVNLQLLAEATNLFNKVNFLPSAPNNSFSSPILSPSAGTNSQIGQNGNPAAGTMSTTLYDPRQLTLSLRLNF